MWAAQREILRSRNTAWNPSVPPPPEALRLEELTSAGGMISNPNFSSLGKKKNPGREEIQSKQGLLLCLPCRVPCPERSKASSTLQACVARINSGYWTLFGANLSSALAASQLLGSCGPPPAPGRFTRLHIWALRNLIRISLWWISGWWMTCGDSS